MHSQYLILTWNETFCEGAKWIHIAQSKGPVADKYMITNPSSAKCVYCVRSDDFMEMLLTIQFSSDAHNILELLYSEDKVITFF
jgi:hypothetical protein